MRTLFFAASCALAANSASAEVVTYDCTLHRLERGWIAERVILSVDAENKRARAYDGYIHEFDGEPKDVKFKETRKGTYRLTWKMKIPSSSGELIYVSYTGTLDPKKQSLNLIARFPQVNASNRPKGEGPCKVDAGPSLYGS